MLPYKHKKWYVHNTTGVTSRFAAVPDQECSVSLAPQQGLCLDAVNITQLPGAFVMVWQILIVIHH